MACHRTAHLGWEDKLRLSNGSSLRLEATGIRLALLPGRVEQADKHGDRLSSRVRQASYTQTESSKPHVKQQKWRRESRTIGTEGAVVTIETTATTDAEMEAGTEIAIEETEIEAILGRENATAGIEATIRDALMMETGIEIADLAILTTQEAVEATQIRETERDRTIEISEAATTR